jgi:hypothetical protein
MRIALLKRGNAQGEQKKESRNKGEIKNEVTTFKGTTSNF